MTQLIQVKPAPLILSRDEYVNRHGSLIYFLECDYCNYDKHICHFCGVNLAHGSWEVRRSYNYYKREFFVLLTPHWLSDCRPDLIDGSYDGSTTTDGPVT